MFRRPGSGAVMMAVAATLLTSCGGDSDTARDEPTETTSVSASASGSTSPTASASTPQGETSSPTAEGECSPPTQEVTYSTGAATLTVDSGEYAGVHELTTEPEKTDESVYQVGFAEQLIGNWRGDLEEQLPALEVRVFNERGDICRGRAVVRLYLPYLAYEDRDSVACKATLSTLTTTAVVGRFACAGIPRTFGSNEPAALGAAGTFSLAA